MLKRLDWFPTLLLTAGIALLGSAVAQACLEEIEPNDTPGEAPVFSEATCLTGVLQGNDQDSFMWEVSEEAAGFPWSIDLESIAGQLTKLDIFRVTLAENGSDVTAAQKVWTLATGDGRPVSGEPFLLAPGRYLLGLSKSGGEGRWVVSLQRGRELARDYGSYEPPVQGELSLRGRLNGATEIVWQIGEEDAAYRWGLQLWTPFTSQPRLTLSGPEGEVTTGQVDDSGRLQLDGLGLGQGEYRLLLEGDEEGLPFTLTAKRQGRLTDGNEIEPNNEEGLANELGFDEPLRASGGDEDRYAFTVGAQEAASAWDLVVESEVVMDLALYAQSGEVLLETSGQGGRLEDLVFDEGNYSLLIDSNDPGAYTLAFERTDQPGAGFEHEPNDTLAGAHPLGDPITVRGELSGLDTDLYRLELEGEPQLWRIQVLGDGVNRVRQLNGGGIVQQEVRGERRIRMDNVVLLPGRHYLEVRGEGGEYALRAIPLGPVPEPEPVAESSEAEDLGTADGDTAAASETGPDGEGEAAAQAAPPAAPEAPPTPDRPAAEADPEVFSLGEPPRGRMEQEPNGDESRSELLRFGEKRVGTLAQDSDRDYYRFFLANEGYVRWAIAPPEGGRIRIDLSGRQVLVTGEEVTESAHFLPAGDYFLTVRNEEWVPGYYQLELDQLDPLALPADLEPNNSDEEATSIPASLSWEGFVGEADRSDYYLIPPFEQETEVVVALEGEGIDFYLAGAESGRLKLERPADGPRALLVAGEETFLVVSGRGRYGVELDFSAEVPAAGLRPAVEGAPVEVGLDLETSEIAAYWHQGQRMSAQLELVNSSNEDHQVKLFARTSSPDVRLEVPEAVSLPAGERLTVPVELLALPDVRDDQPIRVTVAAVVEGGISSSAAFLAPLCDAAPASPAAMWRTPQPLLGHINVLWNAFDLSFDEEAGSGVASLFDGRTAPSTGFRGEAGALVTVDLPGDEPIELSGAMLHPQSRGEVSQQLKDFIVEVSLDGENYTPILEASLESERVEQSFTFDTTVDARFARLRVGRNQSGGERVDLGEWKLIATQALPFGEFDIAHPAVGGHVVWSNPLLPDRGNALLIEGESPDPVEVDKHEVMEWVVGFNHVRAAQVTRLEWQESDDSPTEQRIGQVEVQASMRGAAGPWEPIATWELDRDGNGRAVLDLHEPVWARYLKFGVHIPDGTEELMPPAKLRIVERQAGTEYMSILGQWDHYRKDAWFELQAQVNTPDFTEQDDNDSMESAQGLRTGHRIDGSVEVARDVDWYRIQVAEGENMISLRLDGDPSIDYALLDAKGEPVLYDSVDRAGVVVLQAFVDPGSYYLRLVEPKRSVIFSWDTSGSVGPYRPITYNSLARFARGLDSEREATQLLAFNSPTPIWLLPYWSDDPLRVQRALNEFDRNADSSNSEIAMFVATEALRSREGTRAVLFMTDAETNGYDLTAELWQELGEVRPRVFTFEISSGGSDWTQDLMQDWASVNGGYYDYTRNIGDFDVGFARASCHLRRPKRYSLTLDVTRQEPPGPGQLSVRRADGVSLPAVEVIFDASGSMGTRLESGEQKIVVAKRVLEELVTEILPEGTSFALRAFGHIKPTSCETRLDVPLAPLDPSLAAQAISAIEPKLLSQTPIAASLLAVPGDLAQAGDGSTIILITDGEESCDGDPAAALAQLREQGFDVRLSVVSLGIEDDDVRQEFSDLALLGGGTYVDARDEQALRASIERALYPTFEVLAGNGEVVASGRIDGEPVELEMGIYQVRFPDGTSQQVRVPGDGSVTVEVAGQ